jgi:hypothetical protein
LLRQEEARMGVRTGLRIALCLALAFVGPSRAEAPEAPAVAAVPPAGPAEETEPAATNPRQQFLDQVRAQRQAQADSRRAVEEQRRQRRDAMNQHAENERAAIDLQRRGWPLAAPPPGWGPPTAPGTPAAPQDKSGLGWGGPWWNPPDPQPSGWSNPWYYRGW